MKKIIQTISPFLILVFLGCESNSESGIGKIHWDRDMCARCVMVVSDREHTVQLKDPTTNKQFVFDDIGCLAAWLDETKPKYANSVKVWVTDASSGEFIDARKAFYTTNNITPMSFGFSAYKSKDSIKEGKEIINYDEVIKRSIAKVHEKKSTKKEPAMKCGGDMKCGAGKCGQ